QPLALSTGECRGIRARLAQAAGTGHRGQRHLLPTRGPRGLRGLALIDPQLPAPQREFGLLVLIGAREELDEVEGEAGQRLARGKATIPDADRPGSWRTARARRTALLRADRVERV